MGEKPLLESERTSLEENQCRNPSYLSAVCSLKNPSPFGFSRRELNVGSLSYGKSRHESAKASRHYVGSFSMCFPVTHPGQHFRFLTRV
jgi:hypothetical protein